MKRFISLLSIFLLLSFSINTINAFSDSKTFTQGLYKIEDTGLSTGITYNIRNTSPTGKSVIIVFDSNQMIQELIRLEPNSPDYPIKPLNFGSLIIIIGAGNILFS